MTRVYPLYKYGLAAGNDVSLNMIANIQTVVAPGDTTPFFAPQAFGHHLQGLRVSRLTGVGYRRGFESQKWLLYGSTFNQYMYLLDTILSGVLSGPVTLITRPGRLAYYRYNAVMDLPSTAEQPGGDYYAFRNGLELTFTRMIRLGAVS
jgi:hypothetical protein